MFGIVYGLENLLNHKIYIGQTHRTLEARFRQHKCANTLIGRAIRKYGEENFVKVILEECENQEQLDACEISWIARLNSIAPHGYNLTAGGSSKSGFKVSDEARAKISAIHKGRKRSKETRRKIALALTGNKNFLGHKLSAEHRQKLIDSIKGKPLSDNHKRKLSAAHKGKTAWNKGKKTPPEVRAKLSAAKKGKPSPKKGTTIPPKTRAKIAATLKAYYAKLKETK